MSLIFFLYLPPSIGVTIGFVETSYSVDESDGSAVVTVAVLSGELSDDVVVGFVTLDDTAIGEYTFHRIEILCGLSYSFE